MKVSSVHRLAKRAGELRPQCWIRGLNWMCRALSSVGLLDCLWARHVPSSDCSASVEDGAVLARSTSSHSTLLYIHPLELTPKCCLNVGFSPKAITVTKVSNWIVFTFSHTSTFCFWRRIVLPSLRSALKSCTMISAVWILYELRKGASVFPFLSPSA